MKKVDRVQHLFADLGIYSIIFVYILGQNI
jgi:hypothetical protein